MIDRDIHLLPGNSTPFEQALSAVGHRLLELDVPFQEVLDPYRTPVEFLPVLAHAYSVDIWDDAWPEEKQRWVIANWPCFEAAKGTLGGLEDFVRLVGSDVLQVLVPPDDTFWDFDETPAERRAFLEKFRQLRVYPFFPEIQHTSDCFPSSDLTGDADAYWDDAFTIDEGPDNLFRRQARLFDPADGSGIELTFRTRTERRVSERYVTYDEIILPSKPSEGFFWDDCVDAHYLDVDGSADRLVLRHAVDRTSHYAVGRDQINTVSPGLGAINLEPELVTDTAPLRAGDDCLDGDSFWGDAYLPESDAWRYVFERTFLFEEARVEARGAHGGTFWGYTRLGIPAFTAIAKVDVGDRQPIFAADDGFWDECLPDPDLSRYDAALSAADASRAARDTILLDTQTHRRRRVGDPIVLGKTKVGDFVPDRF